jgi:hypothetical protein
VQLLNDGLRRNGQTSMVENAVVLKLRVLRNADLVKRFLARLLKLGVRLIKIKKRRVGMGNRTSKAKHGGEACFTNTGVRIPGMIKKK